MRFVEFYIEFQWEAPLKSYWSSITKSQYSLWTSIKEVQYDRVGAPLKRFHYWSSIKRKTGKDPECPGMFGHVRTCPGNVPVYLGMSRDVREYPGRPGIFGNVPGYSRISGKNWEGPGMSRNVRECPGMSGNVWECPGMSGNVQECLGMSGTLAFMGEGHRS